MKTVKKMAAVLMSAVMIVCMFTLPVSAAAPSKSTTLSANSTASFSNSGSASKTTYLKIVIPDKGKLTFYDSSSVTDSSTTYAILDSAGKTLLSGKYSALTGKTRTFTAKGTYYLKLTLKKGQSVKKLFYTYVAENGAKVSKKLSINDGKTAALSSYVKNFSGSIKWLSSDSSTVKVSSAGKITAVKAGTAKVCAYSAKGDYAVFTVTVKATDSGAASAAWIMNPALTKAEWAEFSAMVERFRWGKPEFKEGTLTESFAIDLLVGPTTPRVLLAGKYSEKDLEYIDTVTVDGMPASIRVKESIIDDTIYRFFGIKASHKTSGTYWRYKNGYYYFICPDAGGSGEGTVISSEYTTDGRMLVGYRYDLLNMDGSIYKSETSYYLISVYKDSPDNYITVHSICSSKKDALGSNKIA